MFFSFFLVSLCVFWQEKEKVILLVTFLSSVVFQIDGLALRSAEGKGTSLYEHLYYED